MIRKAMLVGLLALVGCGKSQLELQQEQSRRDRKFTNEMEAVVRGEKLPGVRLKSGRDVTVATSPEILVESIKAASNNATVSLAMMAKPGDLFTVPGGTKIEVVDRGPIGAKITIVAAGDNYGRSGWVASDAIAD